jgi:hypothetical protein
MVGQRAADPTVTLRVAIADANTVDRHQLRAGDTLKSRRLQSISQTPGASFANEDTDDTRPKTSLGLGLFVSTRR